MNWKFNKQIYTRATDNEFHCEMMEHKKIFKNIDDSLSWILENFRDLGRKMELKNSRNYHFKNKLLLLIITVLFMYFLCIFWPCIFAPSCIFLMK